ncbi:glycosyltransferase [Microbulbifer pacificus]|uniref:Glycosyltransferase n=1 Tax=Microbulbifer pacificus TaxID=407164 RepID=A0AAU0MWI1_9GAMM|nr:glycosyltransferase [Microbulbifer pacificus]WOX04839.1 glycosyltransferase [Microbulbifer pacificus]
MKILIGMTRSDTVVSGSFKHICQIGERFRQEGIDVTYVLGGDGSAAQALEQRGYRVYKLKNLRRDLNIWFDFIALLQLIWVIFKVRPKICSWHTAKIGALGRIASVLTFRKNYYVPHGVPFVNTPENRGYKKFQLLERILAFLPGTIVGVCQFDKNEYLRIGVPDRKVKVIYNGMAGRKKIHGIAERPRGTQVKFITAARFEVQKDYVTLAKAVEKLHESGANFSLDIYGDGQMEAEVKSLFAALPPEVITFKGVVPDFSVKLAESDIFVLSSHWEGLPRSIIEAMACGKAVIATDVGGSRELINHQLTGYLVPHKDVAALHDCMRTYVEDKDKISQHGKNGFNNYFINFTLEKMLDRYVDEYFGGEYGGVESQGEVA